jgi:DNA (cytosine-5)-methyltransferase 1
MTLRNNEKMTVPYNIRFGEFFCGPGGLALGAKMAAERIGNGIALDHQWSFDYDKDTCDTYRDNLSKSAGDRVVCADIRHVDPSTLSSIDGFMFGFPCNDFSNVGKKKGTSGNFGPLYTYAVKVLETKSPKWFVAENVVGLLSSNGGEDFKMIMEAFRTAGVGYDVVTKQVNFDEFGVPQSRHRIIMVGIRKGESVDFEFPAPFDYKITAGQALTNPPMSLELPNHVFRQMSLTVEERLKFIPEGMNIWQVNDSLPQELRLNVQGAKISSIYRRIRRDTPAYTVTGSGGGGTHMYHWEENRALTNREKARLQSFPDDFIFHGKEDSVRKQIGMAVPPVGVSFILEQLFRALQASEVEHHISRAA